MSKTIAPLAACIGMAVASLLATAQDFPARTIRIVVPFAPGGGSDGIARMLADRMAADLRVSVIVDNKPGASGIIGTETMYRSPADGYTLLLANSAITSNPWL